MAVSGRVAAEQFSDAVEFHGDYAVDRVRGGWRIYEHSTPYSQVSGGVTRRGAVVRRYDPEAGEQEGKPATFKTPGEACAYIDKWLTTRKGKGVENFNIVIRVALSGITGHREDAATRQFVGNCLGTFSSVEAAAFQLRNAPFATLKGAPIYAEDCLFDMSGGIRRYRVGFAHGAGVPETVYLEEVKA